MRRIIDNKVYDTDTATLTHTAQFSEGRAFYEESLYRKRGREFFLYGKGESESKYGFEDRIIPLTLEDAEAWGRGNMDNDAFLRTFKGKVAQNDEKRKVTLYITIEAHERLKHLAFSRKVPMSMLIEEFAKNSK